MNHSVDYIRDEIVPHFPLSGTFLSACPYGSGHINDTYALVCKVPGRGEKRYLLQRINTGIFKDPDGLMENINGVTDYLRRIILEQGGDPERETMTVIRTVENQPYYRDKEGGCWRIYGFIEDTVSYDLVEKPEDFYVSAKAFGRFQMLLSDYPAATLHETIPGFHNTPQRFENLKRAVELDKLGRAKDVCGEIDFAFAREKETHFLVDLLQEGKIPLRVTHNDTKLNNILIDRTTGKGICIIDLDTVMPGLIHYDYGDSIRFGASTALEDERDLDKVSLDLNLFSLFTKGYLEAAGRVLNDTEKKTLPMGAKLMTLECGMRFLTDYLEGDAYFKIHREGHNLDRARTQFKLVADMERKWDRMAEIVAQYS